MHLLQPSSNIQLSTKNPDRVPEAACAHHPPGLGPAVGLQRRHGGARSCLRQGKRIEDARVRRHERLRRDRRLRQGSLHPDRLLQPAEGARDHAQQRRRSRDRHPHRSRQTGDPAAFATFDQVFDAFAEQLKHFFDVKIDANRIIERLYATRMPAPFLSLVIDDCITTGTDYNAGGARYNTTYIMPVGIGTVTDASRPSVTTSSRNGHVTMPALLERAGARLRGRRSAAPAALEQDAALRQRRREADEPRAPRLRHCPRDRRRAPEHPRRRAPSSTTCRRPATSTSDRRPARRPTAGTPGTRSRTAFRRCRAPTGRARRRCFKSAAKMDHARTGGTLLNLKFTPSLLEDEGALDRLAHLVRGYFVARRPSPPVQRRHGRDPARGAGAPRTAPRPHRARRGLQRLLLRPHAPAAGRDHRADRTRDVLRAGGVKRSQGGLKPAPPCSSIGLRPAAWRSPSGGRPACG